MIYTTCCRKLIEKITFALAQSDANDSSYGKFILASAKVPDTIGDEHVLNRGCAHDTERERGSNSTADICPSPIAEKAITLASQVTICIVIFLAETLSY